MNVFQTHADIVSDYATYIRSFLKIDDSAIRFTVEEALNQGKLWPEPLLQFNPSFEMYGSLEKLAQVGDIHSDIRDIFKGYSLYKHQVEAIRLGTSGKDFIVTSGTGSGKSLTYIGSVFHYLLSNPHAKGVTAIVVYPMNALINSQFEEFTRYKDNYEETTGKAFPISFGQYTGQEKEDKRAEMRENPPYYIRKGSSTLRAKGADETELMSLATTIPHDDRVNQQAKVADLSRELMQDYLQQVGSDLAMQAPALSVLELGRQMGVIGGPSEMPMPLNVGLMMFNPEPWRFFPVMQIDVVWFPKEGPGGNKFSEKIFKGPLPRMTRDALDYIKRNLITETVIKHPDRAEATRVENYPYAAIEEAVVNAVYHRGYDTREPVEIRLERDEMMIISYPGPDRSVRLEQLQAGHAQPRRYRNRRIGEFLKELEFTEGRCTGIPKIIAAMAKNGSPPAEFEFDEDHSYFMVRLPIHPSALEVAESAVVGAASGPGRDQVGTKSGSDRYSA